MDKTKTPLLRRTFIGGLLGLFASTAFASTGKLASGVKNRKVAKSTSANGLSPSEVITRTRSIVGIQNAADVTDQNSSKIRVGDNLAQSLSDSELKAREAEYIAYAANTVFQLMDTKGYTHQSQVDMKFIYIPVEQEIKNTLNLLKDNSIDVNSAQQAIRTAFGNFLEGLEQLPTL